MRFRVASIVPVLLFCVIAFSTWNALAKDGEPYGLEDTQVWSVPARLAGRDYSIFVRLPENYAARPERRYPVLYVADADFAFPVVSAIAGRINLVEPVAEEFILVGLSYAGGESAAKSRRRDYTPVKRRDGQGGGGPAYQVYLRDHVIPFVEAKFRADPARRIFGGHSYGGLLGAQILLTEPGLFSGYILGSPSLWYRDHAIRRIEDRAMASRKDMEANVFVYIGELESFRPDDERFNDRRDMVRDAATFVDRLSARRFENLRMKLEVIAGEDHMSVVPSGFTRAIRHLLPPPR